MSKIFIETLEKEFATGNLTGIVSASLSLSEVLKHVGYSSHGRNTKALKDFLYQKSISIDHFTANGMPPSVILTKICPQCGNSFTCKKSEEKETCSHSCANKYFSYKQGTKNKKTGISTYTTILANYYASIGKPIKCCACDFSEVLDVHHIDEDRLNNQLNNLVYLCPNHHALYHRLGDDFVVNSIILELDSRD